jgi:hypothetical protein
VLYDCGYNLRSRISSGSDGDTCDGENDADNYCNNTNNNTNSSISISISISSNRNANDDRDLDGNSSIRSDSHSNSNDNDNSGMHCAINSVDGGGSLTNAEIVDRRKSEGKIGSPNNKKQKMIYDSESDIHAKVRKKSLKKSKIVSIRSCLWGLAFLEKIE